MRDYSDRYAIGKLYPGGIRWFQCYTADLDDLMGPNLVMVSRSRCDLIGMLGIAQ